MSRALRRHHSERLIRRVEGYGPWFRERAYKLYNNRKFCTCSICGNPRRWMRGEKRKQLTVQERRQEGGIRDELALIQWLVTDRLLRDQPSGL